MERKRRSPDLRALGIGLVAGSMIAVATRAPWWGLAAMAAGGALMYHQGLQWE